VKFGRAVFDLNEQTDRQQTDTDTQTNTDILIYNTPALPGAK